MADTRNRDAGPFPAVVYSLSSNQPNGATRMSMRERAIFVGAGITGGVVLAVLFAVLLFKDNLYFY